MDSNRIKEELDLRLIKFTRNDCLGQNKIQNGKICRNMPAEMGFHESPLTSQPKFTKGLSRGEWSVG